MTINGSSGKIGSDSDRGVSDGSSGVAVGEPRMRIMLGLGKGPPNLRYSQIGRRDGAGDRYVPHRWWCYRPDGWCFGGLRHGCRCSPAT